MNCFLSLASVGVVVLGFAPFGHTQAPYMHRLDAINPTTPPSGSGKVASISANGEHVAFYHQAADLLPGALLGSPALGLFAKNLRTGALAQVNLGSQGQHMALPVSNFGTPNAPSISADGRFVAFASITDDPATGDSDGRDDIFVRDLKLGTIERISLFDLPAATLPHCIDPSLSGDGRYVSYLTQEFSTSSGQLVFDALMIFDRSTQQATKVFSMMDKFGSFTPGISRQPVLSSDGSQIAWTAIQNHPVFPGAYGLYTYDVASSQVSEHFGATTSTVTNYGLSIDATGQRIALNTKVSLLSADTDVQLDVYVYDRVTQAITLATDCYLNGNDTLFAAGPSISGDGRYVAFYSTSTCFAATIPGALHVYVTDLVTGLITLQSINDLGQQGDIATNNKYAILGGPQALSHTGQRIVFESTYSNMAGPQPIPSALTSHVGIYMREREVEGPALTILNFFAGSLATVQVQGATPGGAMLVAMSTTGQGPIPTYWGLVDLSGPLTLFSRVADASGFVAFPISISPSAAGVRLWAKGLDLSASQPTTSFMGVVQ